MSVLDNEIIEFRDSMGKTVQFVKGDENTDVQTPNGPIPTLAKQAKAARTAIEALLPNINNRLRIDAAGNYSAAQQVQARKNLGLDKIDNTADVDKPASQATLDAISSFSQSIAARENPVNKNQPNGYVGLSNLRLMVRNVANTITSFISTEASSARDWLLPNKSGTIALTSDITGENSGRNTGDETTATILAKLQSPGLSGLNTGDETKATILTKLGASAVTGSNTGDETKEKILQKIGVTTLTGSNTGDETRATIVSKIGYDVVDKATLNQANGPVLLDATGKVPSNRLPEVARNFIKVADITALPADGREDAIYVTANNSRMYYWNGTTYADLGWAISNTNQLTEGSNNLYFTQARVRTTTLAGLVTTNQNAIVAGDQQITAFGKLQAQINALTADGSGGFVTLSGDVTGSGSGNITVTISDNAVSLNKLAAIPSGHILGRSAANNGNVEILSIGAMRAMLLLSNVDNTSDANKVVSNATQAALNNKENSANKATSFAVSNNTLYPTIAAVKSYVDNLVAGLVKDCGNYNASVNTWPASGGTGAGGAIQKGNFWYINVAGVLGGVPVNVGDSLRALTDAPGQTNANWAVLEGNIGYVPYNATNPNGYTANQTDAYLLNRANHTGNQSAGTIVETAAKSFVTQEQRTAIAHTNRAALDVVSGTNTGDQTITLTGDASGGGTGTFAVTIAPKAVSFDKMADVSTGVLLGRSSTGTGAIQTLNAATAKTLLGLGNVNNTADADKPVSSATTTELLKKEDTSNKTSNFSSPNNTAYPTTLAVSNLLDDRMSAMWKDCGPHNASVGTFPTTGGSGANGLPKVGDIWTVTVAGTLGGKQVSSGDTLRALVDTPAQTANNWVINQSTFGYTPLNKAGDTLAGTLTFANGANLAAAVTTNLTTPKGNIVELTGNGISITALTLALGDMKIVRFAGTNNTLVHNATSLRLPGGRSIRVQPGDYAIFAGKSNGAGGVISDCVSYVRANGTTVQSANIEKTRSITANTSTTAVSLETGDSATVYKVTIAANTTIMFDTPPALLPDEIYSFTLITINDATANRAMSFGNNVTWADDQIPPRTAAANAVDVWTFFYDGVAYSGSLSIANKK